MIMNIFENLQKWVLYGIYGMFILTLLNTCNGCNRNKDQVRLKKEIILLQQEIDSLYFIINNLPIIDRDEMKKLLNDNMWKFLEIEELSDKNHIPINQFKHKDKTK